MLSLPVGYRQKSMMTTLPQFFMLMPVYGMDLVRETEEVVKPEQQVGNNVRGPSVRKPAHKLVTELDSLTLKLSLYIGVTGGQPGYEARH